MIEHVTFSKTCNPRDGGNGNESVGGRERLGDLPLALPALAETKQVGRRGLQVVMTTVAIL